MLQLLYDVSIFAFYNPHLFLDRFPLYCLQAGFMSCIRLLLSLELKITQNKRKGSVLHRKYTYLLRKKGENGGAVIADKEIIAIFAFSILLCRKP